MKVTLSAVDTTNLLKKKVDGSNDCHGFKSRFKAEQFQLFCNRLDIKTRLHKLIAPRKMWLVEILGPLKPKETE